MENIGPVASHREALCAIRFLARLSHTPIRFFGIAPSDDDGSPWLTFDKKTHERLCRQNRIGIGMGVAEMAGALDAWRALLYRARRLSSPKRPR